MMSTCGFIIQPKMTRASTLALVPGHTITRCTSRQAPGGSGLWVREHFQVFYKPLVGVVVYKFYRKSPQITLMKHTVNNIELIYSCTNSAFVLLNILI